MKATGIVRQVDELGRIVLPMELRKVLSIKEKEPIEIFVNGNQIILEKYQPGCHLCGEVKLNLGEVNNKKICPDCAEKVYKLYR
ncbi:AbrB/MazE/SpoVT family DNA-binding domain-containing protein [Sutcliffiella horikoshii]|uniref:AbrB/MazE/SpoVT family DNA-binding domain-containing protein n=1 Tax=Sutcliffiella horikoshii TaxID=79883 RepID=A0A5D4SA42_9BACI|nr:AbrB/MazE/SpoVT family DNA-binding domain-containing protein [Sutcliffiella horikoshii]TYS60517.1 AbrB/MazE/SpoVT family DNA-binding domain-containing protein [Sutcliffiella horikoshii]